MWLECQLWPSFIIQLTFYPYLTRHLWHRVEWREVGIHRLGILTHNRVTQATTRPLDHTVSHQDSDKVAYQSQLIEPQYTLNSIERHCEKRCALDVSVVNIFSGNSLLGMTITEAGRSQNPKVFMQCNKGHKICKVYLRQPKINFIPWSTDCLSKYGENNIGNSWWLRFFSWYNSIVCTGKQ